MSTKPTLSELIAKFCAPDDNSDRPIHCVTPKPSQREQTLQQILEAITEAEETAIANKEPIANKAQIMESIGKTMQAIYYYPEALTAYDEAVERVGKRRIRRQPAAPSVQVETPSPTLQIAPQAQSTIALTLEVSEAVYSELQRYLERNTDWDSDRVAEAALALFLLQNRTEQGINRELSRVYLNSVLRSTAA